MKTGKEQAQKDEKNGTKNKRRNGKRKMSCPRGQICNSTVTTLSLVFSLHVGEKSVWK